MRQEFFGLSTIPIATFRQLTNRFYINNRSTIAWFVRE